MQKGRVNMARNYISMRLLSAVMLLNILMVANVSTSKGKLKKTEGAGGNDVTLNGFTADSTHLPMQLKCDASDEGISLGSITIDSKQVSDILLASVNKECERTTNLLKTGPRSERLRCELVLNDAKGLSGKEHIRVVYQCARSSSGWAKETVKTTSQKKAGKDVTMKCSNNLVIFKITSVKIDGVNADASKYPELGFSAIERECFGQSIKRRNGNSNGKVKYECSIENKAKYGGALEISYRCDTSPTY